MNKDLQTYLEDPLIRTIKHDGEKFWFKKPAVVAKGLLSKLKKAYYPGYKYKVGKKPSRKKVRKGSNTNEGKAVGKQLTDYIKSKNNKKTLALRYSRALVEYWEDQMGHTLCATEVPTFVSKFNCCTAADMITEDRNHKLHLWEIKCGANSDKKQGFFNFEGKKVPNTRKNHWELQRYYTTKGFLDKGLPLVGSHVINVYDYYDKKTKKTKVEVKQRKRPAWINKRK